MIKLDSGFHESLSTAKGLSIARSVVVRLAAITSLILALVVLFGLGRGTFAQDSEEIVNSIGMKLRRIEPGSFMMGASSEPLPEQIAEAGHQRFGDFDERPAHRVTISSPFHIGVHEVTNEQYEQYDPDHRKVRGKLGFSKEDDEAVVFVDWNDAAGFTRWLSEKEGRPYRLPTEAEWEYAARAGTTTPYHTGETLPEAFHKNARMSWFPDPARGGGPEEVVPLRVGQTPANPWGLFDMHGNVEEWIADWYGPYESGAQTDPVGRDDGDFRVTRGGSHSTLLYYLRSANRSGDLPGDKSWLIGFRVVLGEMPETKPLPVEGPRPWQQDVSQQVPPDLAEGPDPSKPYFKGPIQYVKVPDGAQGPLFDRHNHDPAIVECPNGDLLVIWYTCVTEPGRELALAASRLRYGSDEWEPASPFLDTPDRNDHAPAMWFDGSKTIFQFWGLSAAATWGNTATVLRTSTDSGRSWSKPRIIVPEHGIRHMPVESVIRTQDGAIVLPADAVTGGNGGTALWFSRDNGKTWNDPGGTIAGIHAGVVELSDGRLYALGRGDTIDGHMPQSISSDDGKTWERTASPFPPIRSAQRLALLRLKEGPIFLASFADTIEIVDASGKPREVSGLYAAMSYDDAKTWKVLRPITDDGRGRTVETMDGRPFLMSWSSAEPRGYLSICQTADGVIHLIGSRQHYAFNLKWLETPAPAEPRSR